MQKNKQQQNRGGGFCTVEVGKDRLSLRIASAEFGPYSSHLVGPILVVGHRRKRKATPQRCEGAETQRKTGSFPSGGQPIEVHHFVDMALMKLSRLLISPEAMRYEVSSVGLKL